MTARYWYMEDGKLRGMEWRPVTEEDRKHDEEPAEETGQDAAPNDDADVDVDVKVEPAPAEVTTTTETKTAL